LANSTTPLTEKQYEIILDTFIDREDYRMAIVCLMMEQCLRIQDILNFNIGDVYHQDGTPRSEIVIKESKRRCKACQSCLEKIALRTSIQNHL